jgi:predicted nucleic acid-binding Zn ribbon protein
VHFKGSGFYSTDYGRGSRKAAAKEGGDSAEKTAAEKAADKGTGEKKPAAEPG